MNEQFRKRHCAVVILGLPSRPAQYLYDIYRKERMIPTVFTASIPFPLILFPLARFCNIVDHPDDILCMELTAFAERNEEKKLTLIPATEHARRFVSRCSVTLETHYIIQP